jgi:hypothetical protein
MSLPRGDPNLDLQGNDILDANGNSQGAQSTAGLMTHELQHEYDSKHPNGTRPSGQPYPPGDKNAKFKSPGEKSAVDAENALRKHCPAANAGPLKGRYE